MLFKLNMIVPIVTSDQLNNQNMHIQFGCVFLCVEKAQKLCQSRYHLLQLVKFNCSDSFSSYRAI